MFIKKLFGYNLNKYLYSERIKAMVRKKCDWYPGSIHHITCRGNRRSDLFKAEEDYIIFLAIVKEVMEKLPFKLYSYCLTTVQKESLPLL